MCKYSQHHCRRRCGFPLSKTKNAENFIFASLFRSTVDFINHIHIYCVCTNTVKMIVGVVVVSDPSKNRKSWKIYFWWLIKMYIWLYQSYSHVFSMCEYSWDHCITFLIFKVMSPHLNIEKNSKHYGSRTCWYSNVHTSAKLQNVIHLIELRLENVRPRNMRWLTSAELFIVSTA